MPTTEIDIQIRFADADILGHINNVNMQHYFDLGKTDFFRKVLGVSHVGGEQGIITAATNTSYSAQTRLDDKIFVETTVKAVGNKSITLFQRIIDRHNSEVKAESTSTMVVFDFTTQSPFSVPDLWRKSLL